MRMQPLKLIDSDIFNSAAFCHSQCVSRSSGMPIPYKEFQGFRVPVGADEGRLRAACNHPLQPGTVVISSYPKCGTTWLQHIVFLLLRGGRPADSASQVVEAVPFPEQDGLEEGANPRALKYHLPFRQTPMSKDAFYLYVARNPKDACVSYYHFLKDLPGYHIKDFDEFFEAFLAGEVPYGDLLDHVLEWQEGACRTSNVLLVTYEDLSRDREAIIRRIANFLGLQGLDDAAFKDVLEYSSFEYMRDLASRDDFMLKYLLQSTGGQKGTEGHRPRMLRKGVVGDWRAHFTPEQSARMDEHFSRKMKDTSWEKAWPKDMAHERPATEP
ncbi:sulfotransferase 1C4 [Caerostris extrusa]|uniref:Sulfotransferase 1C4 n=1 Tax=Caerostris extrusa TaxID=172846 RepID=A0AAV4WT36_CAEEX|nr:sulfotransferase 1C4 [Caerostris extrusa]